MSSVARALVVAGLLLVAAGIFWQVVGKQLPLGRLPGDVVIEGNHFRFFFPVVTCILVSVVLTLVSLLWRYLGR
jgi:hypothetical protein